MTTTRTVEQDELDATDDNEQPGSVSVVAPSARCHECGRTTIRAVCCNCARLSCSLHDVIVGPRRVTGLLPPDLFGRKRRTEPPSGIGRARPTPRSDGRRTPEGPDNRDDGPQRPTEEGEPDTEHPTANGEAGRHKAGRPAAGERRRTPAVGAGRGAAGRPPDAGTPRAAEMRSPTVWDDADPLEPPADDDGPDDEAPVRSDLPGNDGDTAARRGDSGDTDEDDSIPIPDDIAGSVGASWARRLPGTTTRHYCSRCAPQVRPLDVELLAATGTIGAGLAVASVSSVVGVLLMCVGGVRVAVRTVRGVRQRRRQHQNRSADLRLDPNIRKVRLREKLDATMRLTPARTVETGVGPLTGSVRLEGSWSRTHRASIDAHRRQSGSAAAKVSAGHIVLRGPGRATFSPAADGRANGGAALVLEPVVADQPMLSDPSGHGDARWRPTYDYVVQPPDGPRPLPVWIVPGITPGSDMHVLELDVQWSTRDPVTDKKGVPLESIRELEIHVPADWGDVESTTIRGDVSIGLPVTNPDGSGTRRLRWRRAPVARADRGSLRLRVRFSEQIDLATVVTGRIDARFGGALSGLVGVGVHRTTGSARSVSGALRPQTSVCVDLHLSLAGLGYQEHRSVPDRTRPEDDDRRETVIFPGVPPDHHTVALVTDRLSDDGYYILLVHENRPQPGTHRGSVNRVWDIEGRYYEGLYPIDFHLVLTGEEVHRNGAVTGETAVRLTVHGSFATERMHARVIEEWDRLSARIRLDLEGAGGSPRRRPVGQPLDGATAELVRLRDTMLTVADRITESVDTGDIEPRLATELASQIKDSIGLGDA